MLGIFRFIFLGTKYEAKSFWREDKNDILKYYLDATRTSDSPLHEYSFNLKWSLFN